MNKSPFMVKRIKTKISKLEIWCVIASGKPFTSHEYYWKYTFYTLIKMFSGKFAEKNAKRLSRIMNKHWREETRS